MLRSRRRTRAAVVGAVVSLLGALGCGPAGPKTYPVHGKVEVDGGDVKLLSGCHVEAALASDPTVRASGVIGRDGHFTLETPHEGRMLNGAREGEYLVRIVLSDDDDDDKARKRQRRSAVNPRFLLFNSSGLKLKVPADGDVTLKVSPR